MTQLGPFLRTPYPYIYFLCVLFVNEKKCQGRKPKSDGSTLTEGELCWRTLPQRTSSGCECGKIYESDASARPAGGSRSLVACMIGQVRAPIYGAERPLSLLWRWAVIDSDCMLARRLRRQPKRFCSVRTADAGWPPPQSRDPDPEYPGCMDRQPWRRPHGPVTWP